MERLSAWLAEMLQLEGINRAELGRRLGVSEALVGRWIKGKDMPSYPNSERLGAYYDISPHAVYAMAGRVEEQGEGEVVEAIERSRSVVLAKLLARFGEARAVAGLDLPKLGPVSAGIPEHLEEGLKEVLGVPGGVLLTASGDCLRDLGLADGDLILIDPSARDPKRNQIIIARLPDGETTLKRYQPMQNGTVQLAPANEGGPYKAITANTGIEVLGTAKWRLRAL